MQKSFLDGGVWPGQRRIRGLSVMPDVQGWLAHGLVAVGVGTAGITSAPG